MARGTEPPTDLLTVRVLGPVLLVGPSESVEVRGRQPSTVLAHLAIERRGATRDELAEVLWGHRLSNHWQGALRGVLSKVRAALVECGLPASTIRSDDTVVRLDHRAVTTDLDEITALVDDPSAELDALTTAAGDLAHPFLPHDDSEWGRRVRARIYTLRRRTVHRRAQVSASAGLVDQAIAQLRQAIEDEPLDETAHHLLIELLLGDGQRVAASDAFDKLTTSLAHELGVAPARATAELFRPADHAAPATPRSTGEPDGATRAQGRIGGPIHPHTDDPFVGRELELAVLRATWAQVIATDRPHLVIVQGPPGMGKTRLVDRFCSELQQSGQVDQVVWGRSRDTVDRAYGALADAVGRLLTDRPEMVQRLGDELGGLAPLLPGRPAHGVLDPGSDDSATSRAAITHSLRVLLTALLERPTIWFTDDLQWSSADAIGTLEEAVDGLSGPLLVLATTRAVDGDVAGALASLQRILPTAAIPLAGLTVDDIADLFADAEIAPTVRAHTAGLPFYASEIARVARLSGDAVDLGTVPAAITEWVSRRVGSLQPDERRMLQRASVIGEEIDVDLLAQCSSGSPIDVARICDHLVSAGLLTSTISAERGGSPVLQFSHRITRDVVYGDIGPSTRPVLHRHVADTIATCSDGRRGEDAGLDHAALAHHYALAGDATRQVAWGHAMRAARGAMRAGAWATAERQFDLACDRASGPRTLGHALVGRGRAEHAQLRFDDARTTLHEALAIAEADGLAIVHATATLALVGRAGRGASLTRDDTEHVRLLRDTLAMIERAGDEPSDARANDIDVTAGGGRPDELRSALERELALSLLLSDAVDERAALLQRSVDRARHLQPPDPETLASALLGSRYAKLEPRELESRLADVDEVLALPARSIGDDTRLAAYCYRHEDLLRLGELDAAADTLERAERLATRYPHPYWTWAVRTWRALAHLHSGHLDRAESDALAAAALRPQVAEAAACLAVNLVDIRLYQHRAGEMIPAMDAAVGRHPEIPAYRAVLALCAAEAGDVDLAASSLRWFADAGVTNLPFDTNRSLALGALAHTAATVGDRDAAIVLTTLLEPARDHWFVLQCYGGGGATWGPVAHALARLAALDGRPDDARALYDRAASQAATTPLVLDRIDLDRRHDHPAPSP